MTIYSEKEWLGRQEKRLFQPDVSDTSEAPHYSQHLGARIYDSLSGHFFCFFGFFVVLGGMEGEVGTLSPSDFKVLEEKSKSYYGEG